MQLVRYLVLLSAMALAGCTTESPRATEVEMSTKYDKVDCAKLIADRNALQAKHPNLPPDRNESALAWGGFAAVGDTLALAGHEERVAKGRIEAMSDSIRRRKCGG